MKVQRVRLPESQRVSWLVLGDDYLPIEPIRQFLHYVETLGSPFTVRTYAYHLLLFWRFLVAEELDWLQIRLSHLADFVHWLRLPAPEGASPERQVARRHETSINAIMNGVTSFYEFHHRDKADLDLPLYREAFLPNRRYKNFLY